jgi:hypothetical protein
MPRATLEEDRLTEDEIFSRRPQVDSRMELMQLMRECGVTVTRENYIAMAWDNKIPDPWTPEHETMLPPELQKTECLFQVA